MMTPSDSPTSSVTFKGKSGTSYRFQAWPMETRFKAMGGIYVVTKRECLNRTFPSMATHRCLAIGQTANLGACVLTAAELKKLVAQGANCICVYPVADESSRVRIEQDLIEGNDQWGAQLQFLFRAPVPERAPGISGES